MQHPGAYGGNEVDTSVEGIAWLVVQVIKNSWGVYNDTFAETRMASRFFEWVKEQVEGILSTCVDSVFADIFRRQLYGYPQGSQVYVRSKEGVEQVWSELKGLGLDMTFLLNTLITAPLEPERPSLKSGSASSSSLVEGIRGLGLETL
jgi:hypothetical protein